MSGDRVGVLEIQQNRQPKQQVGRLFSRNPIVNFDEGVIYTPGNRTIPLTDEQKERFVLQTPPEPQQATLSFESNTKGTNYSRLVRELMSTPLRNVRSVADVRLPCVGLCTPTRNNPYYTTGGFLNKDGAALVAGQVINQQGLDALQKETNNLIESSYAGIAPCKHF